MPLPYCVPADEAPPGEYQCPCHSQKPLIAPSVLACDLSKLTEESMGVLAAGADVLHLDVMVRSSHPHPLSLSGGSFRRALWVAQAQVFGSCFPKQSCC